MAHKELYEEIHELPVSARDLAALFLGKKLGSGMSRDVYEFTFNRDYVVKVENSSGSFQNIIEWEIWNNVQYMPSVSKWFAPCVNISPCGVFLIQRKVIQQDPKKYPKKVPYFFKDTKYENFGTVDGKLVCCDYGTFLREDHFNTKRMKNADWWSTI